MGDRLRLVDLLGALSVATDLAMGQAPEKSIRACVLATEIARHLGAPEPEVADVYYTTLLKHLGCTATMHEETLFGPDVPAGRRVAERTDVARPSELLRLLLASGAGTGAGRARYVARAATAGKETNEGILRAICEVAARMAERLGFGEGVVRALYESLERWDGKGSPKKVRGEAIALPSRIAEPATQAVIFHRLGGAEAALAMIDRRSGGWFDPAIAAGFRAVGPDVLGRLEHDDPWAALLDAEPEPRRWIQPDRIAPVAEVFGDMVDLGTAYTLGHAAGVAELATAAAPRLGLGDVEGIRVAALLHDLGRIAVSSGIWEKAAPLSSTEWEAVRLHPYHTERILARSSALAPLARVAGMHHERQDGSGYHHGAAGAEVPPEARLLAVADAYQAKTQDRPHRPALPPERAADAVSAEAAAGRFDPECARAALSDREVEVLRLVARGLSNRAIAERLVISPRTAEHHVQHVYAKIGVSTRAAAAVFAMEHALVR